MDLLYRRMRCKGALEQTVPARMGKRGEFIATAEEAGEAA
jgi:hypothetical protein